MLARRALARSLTACLVAWVLVTALAKRLASVATAAKKLATVAAKKVATVAAKKLATVAAKRTVVRTLAKRALARSPTACSVA
jgi:CRP-like cAMP-binding protein